jgi:hypothetical protein
MIGDINPLRGASEVARPTVAARPAAPSSSEPVLRDQVDLQGGQKAAPASVTRESSVATEQPVVKAPTLAEARGAFKQSLLDLAKVSPEDSGAIDALAKAVGDRPDLSSKEKEYLFATEVAAYTVDASMKINKDPNGVAQSDRLAGLTQAFRASKGLHDAVSPGIVAPDGIKTGTSVPPSFDLGAPGGGLAEGSIPAAPANVPGNVPSNPAVPPENGAQPPAEPPKPDAHAAALKLYQARQEEAQDAFKDWKTIMQKMSDWKQRIAASRMAFFWRVYNMHADYISGKTR